MVGQYKTTGRAVRPDEQLSADGDGEGDDGPDRPSGLDRPSGSGRQDGRRTRQPDATEQVEARVEATWRDPAWVAACCAAAQEIAAHAYDMTRDQMLASRRCKAWIAEGRQVAMYLAHVIAQIAPTDAAPHFRRDRTTIAHACRKIEDRRDDAYFDNGLARLEEKMMQALGQLKMERLLAEERAEAGDAEAPVLVRTARGRFYRLEPFDE